MRRIIVFGGYGVFGSQAARVLANWDMPLTIAGRDLAAAEEFARTLGGDCSAVAANLTQTHNCRAALAGHAVALNCAGPLSGHCEPLLNTCLQAGVHYADIIDDRRHAAVVRSFGGKFQQRGLAAVYGCSSLPGISGALALLAKEKATPQVHRVRVTLFIGNNNPKGQAAVWSLVEGLGETIAAPQGTLYGFCDREVVQLPAPFGRRGVFNFESPEYDLFPSLLGQCRGCESRLRAAAGDLQSRIAGKMWCWLWS